MESHILNTHLNPGGGGGSKLPQSNFDEELVVCRS